MFVAKFNQTSGAPFESDKHEVFPYIGTVLAGKATGSIINGTMFQREKLEENKMYLCDNHIDPEYPDNVQTTVISSLTVLEFMSVSKELGKASLVRATAEVEAEIPLG